MDRTDTGAGTRPAASSRQLRAPRLRRDRLDRGRLTDLLEESDAPLIVVAAPAGFGKTTAVMNWLEATEHPFVWLAADEANDDVVRFFSALTDSLEPHIGRGRLHGLLTNPSDGSLTPGLVASAAAEDLNGLDDNTVLLIEDLHRVSDAGIHETLRAMVDHVARHVRLAITSRSDPQFPLAKLRADGQLSELRSDDLAFTLDESVVLLTSLVGRAIPAEAAAVLNSRIEGWAAGLQLAGLSLAGRDDLEQFVRDFAGDDRHVADYLLQEVLERESPDMQRFLLETSMLDDLNASLCTAATGDDHAAERLEELYDRNLFISALDDKRQWFRYHHLFADLLKARLSHAAPDRYREVVRNAAVWCENRQDPDRALRYLIAAGALEEAAALERRHASGLLTHGEIGRLMWWLEMFPTGFVESDPELLLGRAWCALFTLRSEDARRDLDLAETMGSEAFDMPIYGQLEIMRSMAAWNDGDAETTKHHAERGLRELPPQNRNLPSLGHLHLGRAAFASRDIETAEAEFVEAASHGEGVGNLFVALSARLGQAAVDWYRGDLRAARRRYDAAVSLREHPANAGRDFPVLGAAVVGHGVLAFEAFELAEAVELFRRGINELRRTAFLEYTILGYRRWSEAESFLGNHAAAVEVLSEARDHLDSFGRGGRALAQALADCEVRNLLRTGDVDAAELSYRGITLDQLQRPGDLASPEFDRAITGMWIDLARNRNDGTVDRARTLTGFAGDNVGLRIKAMTAHAAALAARGDDETAKELVMSALQLAAAGGWVRPFVAAGLGRLLPAGDPDPAVSRLLERTRAGLRLGSGEKPRRQTLADPLTPRELEVLGEIAAGLTNAQIAERLFISVGTAKRHVANIYMKLAAGHRAEAAAKARALGLVD